MVLFYSVSHDIFDEQNQGRMNSVCAPNPTQSFDMDPRATFQSEPHKTETKSRKKVHISKGSWYFQRNETRHNKT